MTAKSVFNSKIDEALPGINGPSSKLVGKVKSKRCVLRCFLKVATEVTEQTDSVRRGARVKCSCTCVGLDPRDRQ